MSIYVALLAGCVLTIILGKFVLAELRKLKAGQEIRQDGPPGTIPRRAPHHGRHRLYSGQRHH